MTLVSSRSRLLLAGGVLLTLCACSDQGGSADSRKAVELPPVRPDGGSVAEQRMQEARSYLAAGRVLYALQALDQVIAEDPNSVPALRLHALVLINRGEEGDVERAVEELRKVLSIAPSDVEALASLAGTLGEYADPAEVAQVVARFDDAVAKGAEASDLLVRQVRFAEGKTALRAGELEKALAVFDTLIAAEPGDGEIRFSRILALEGLGRLEDAEAEAATLLTAYPERAPLYELHSRLLNLLGRTEEAKRAADLNQRLLGLADPSLSLPERVQSLTELVALVPASQRLRWDLARAQIAAKQGAEAEKIARSFLAKDAADPEAFFILSQALAVQGDVEGAKAAARELANSGKVSVAVVQDLERRIAEISSSK